MAYLRRTASLSHRVIGGDGAAKRRRTTAAAIVPRPPIYPPPLTPHQAQQDACISIPSLVYDETAVQAHEEMIFNCGCVGGHYIAEGPPIPKEQRPPRFQVVCPETHRLCKVENITESDG